MILVTAVAGALVAATVVSVSPYVYRAANSTSSVDADIDLGRLDDYAVRSYMYASDGSLLTTLHGAENRVPVTLDRIPKPVVDSILAVEDADFYQHPGVNMRGIFRAMVENVSSGGNIEQGGSTITQQLVKKTFVGEEQTADRKSVEMAMALRLEKKLTKDQILELYLNTVYFGSGAYGVQAAAETYWGVDVSFLGYAEGAMLAGLIRNPVKNDPTLYPDNAEQARLQALDRLVVTKKITPEDAEKAGRATIPKYRCGQEGSNPAFCAGLQPPPPRDYFEDEVRQRLLNDPIYGLGATQEERERTLFGGGIKIYTTVNPQAQVWMRDTYERIVPKDEFKVFNPETRLEEVVHLTAAMVSVEPGTGAVRAMLGGPGFEQSKFNNAIGTIGRQTGSSFKTFTLLTALEQGAVPDDYIAGGGDFPNKGGFPDPYRIGGPGGTLDGVTTSSSNGAFVRLYETVGRENVIRTAVSLGLTSNLIPVLNLTLGTVETKPIEMATAYASLPNGGIYQPYYLIDKVLDRNGVPLYEHFGSGRRAVSAESACLATQILNHNTQYGTGTRARLDRQPAAGKTGTTDKGADVWFVGYTPYLSTAVWMGIQESNAPLPSIDGTANMGGFFPARMWGDFNAAYHQNQNLPVLPFAGCGPTRGGRTVVGPGSNNKNMPAPNSEFQEEQPVYQPPATTAPPTFAPPITEAPPTTDGPTRTTSTGPPVTEPPVTQPPPSSTPPPSAGGSP